MQANKYIDADAWLHMHMVDPVCSNGGIMHSSIAASGMLQTDRQSRVAVNENAWKAMEERDTRSGIASAVECLVHVHGISQ